MRPCFYTWNLLPGADCPNETKACHIYIYTIDTISLTVKLMCLYIKTYVYVPIGLL